ncbi:hypothetical protein [Inhella sp.]|uniref:hypothetical protein n=1 Tax=Inhella sp. TaxID=1921806 RepID=UPI0035AE669C
MMRLIAVFLGLVVLIWLYWSVGDNYPPIRSATIADGPAGFTSGSGKYRGTQSMAVVKRPDEQAVSATELEGSVRCYEVGEIVARDIEKSARYSAAPSPMRQEFMHRQGLLFSHWQTELMRRGDERSLWLARFIGSRFGYALPTTSLHDLDALPTYDPIALAAAVQIDCFTKKDCKLAVSARWLAVEPGNGAAVLSAGMDSSSAKQLLENFERIRGSITYHQDHTNAVLELLAGIGGVPNESTSAELGVALSRIRLLWDPSATEKILRICSKVTPERGEVEGGCSAWIDYQSRSDSARGPSVSAEILDRLGFRLGDNPHIRETLSRRAEGRGSKSSLRNSLGGSCRGSSEGVIDPVAAALNGLY